MTGVQTCALPISYTYNPLTGKTSSLDVNNRTAISVLDNEGKTILTRDLENDIKTRTVYDYSLANKNNPFINFEYLTKDNAVNNKYYIKVNSNMLENGNKIFIDYGDGTNVNVTNLDEVIHLYPITKNKNYPVSMVVKDKDNKSISNTIIENIYIK